MDPKQFFSQPLCSRQRQYEALKAFYHDGVSATEAAARFGFSRAYFKKLRGDFVRHLRQGHNPFFQQPKPGPKQRHSSADLVGQIVALRKRNYAITDIKATLQASGPAPSLETIDRILKAEGFAPLPKRTRQQRLDVAPPAKFTPPRSTTLNILDEEFTTARAGGALIFLPLLASLGIIPAINAAGFPATREISAIQALLSLLALKLLGVPRWSHDSSWNLDRALGLFAGLNVLPKATTLASYSYRVTRAMNRQLLMHLSRCFQHEGEAGEFNLDFKTIPHWGDASVLDKHWSGSRAKALKSVLALIVQDPDTGQLSYTNAEIQRHEQSDAVLDFVDFWTQGRGVTPKLLIFDSKFTTYQNLDKLNQSPEQIKFLTLRRRGKKLLAQVAQLPAEAWQTVSVERAKGQRQTLRVHDGTCTLRHYQGELRQVVLTDHGRQQPTFLITNDFALPLKQVVQKYARRWLVAQEIAEQIVAFHLNSPSSSIVVKVDLDLTLSLLAHNLYRRLGAQLPGFEQCTVETIRRRFLENGAAVMVRDHTVTVQLNKKTHLPILFEVPWMSQTSELSWMGLKIRFVAGTVS
jgi:hypothetical protein